MTHRVERHAWRTADGNRLVPTGHPDAAFLAYAAGTDIPEEEARRFGLLIDPPPVVPVEPLDPAEVRAKPPPADKMRTPTANKTTKEQA